VSPELNAQSFSSAQIKRGLRAALAFRTGDVRAPVQRTLRARFPHRKKRQSA